jgi:hypothetical protein
MSCCGQKRAQLLRQETQRRQPTVSVINDQRPEPARPPRIFEYLGVGSLVLRGTVSGSTYRFSHPGDCVEVAYEDTFALLAEQIVRPKN